MTTMNASTAARRPLRTKGRALFAGDVRLALAAHSPGDRPQPVLPVMVVLGRSNVGKSSLLNALLRVKVARVSQTPGRTQALYWYRVGGAFDLVDCPGYGFAKASRESREAFSRLIETLLVTDPRPSVALLLVDGRLEPQEGDRSMVLFLRQAGVPTVVAATKWDAVKPSRRVRQLRQLAAEYQDPTRPLQPVSSETGENLPQLALLLEERLTTPPREASRPRG
jgi:GTP-binding protein